MSINPNGAYARDFGYGRGNGRLPAANETNPNEPKKKAQFWFNIGYMADYVLPGEETPRFIALSQGIPLDTIPDMPTDRGNANQRKFMAEQNLLKAEFIEEAEKLEPGQDILFQIDGSSMQVQLRRVRYDDTPTTVATDETHPFGRRQKLFVVQP